MRHATAALIALICATTAQADLSVTFRDGAPTDRFSTGVTTGCIAGPLRLTIDLAGSDAGLIFDVTGAGAGVQVFQPFVLVAGAQVVTGVSPIGDGDTVAVLDLARLSADTPIAFTIDLDDTIDQREITVSGAEIAGATVSLETAQGSMTVPFDDQGNADAAIPATFTRCDPTS